MKQIVADILLCTLFALCLILGGASDGGYFANLALQFGAVFAASIVWSAWGLQGPLRYSLALKLLAVAAGLAAMLQFMPLPLEVWRSLPGRAALAADLAGIGLAPEPALVTLLYHDSISALTWALPAFGVFLTTLCLPQVPARKLAMILTGFSVIAIGVGLVQFFGPRESAAYFYQITNRGSMVGFFANANHMATLLLTALPFIAALVHDRAGSDPENALAIRLIGGLLAVVFLFGLVMIGSGTGYALALPVIVLSLLIWASKLPRLAARVFVPGAFAAAAAVLAITGGTNVIQGGVGMSADARELIFANTWQAILEFFPLGTGLGTFPDVYPMFENPDVVDRNYINHAHNDYLELALELGLPGVLLLIGFFAWWAAATLSIWRTATSSPFAKAATIASGVIQLHSLWDYPLRTAAIGAVMAVCCALMARHPIGRSMRTAQKSSVQV